MFFRRGPRKPPGRSAAWRDLAGRLELADASSVAERMRRYLALGEVEVGPLYALKRDGQPTLYLFDFRGERRGPAGAVHRVASGCLLRSRTPFAPLPLRAIPKQNPVLEQIEAGRAGGQPVDPPGPVDFAERVTVIARDPQAAASALTGPVRTVLERVLHGREAARVVVGERHILTLFDAAREPGDGPGDGTPLETLELVASDLLALYAALVAQGAAERGDPSPPLDF